MLASMLDRIKALNADLFDEVVQLRRTIHRNPELAFQENDTARLVTATLSPLGFDLRTGVARTGVIATLDTGRPGAAIALRADMDALPIQEENDFEFASVNPGKMHACGHDAHTSSLLGTAMILHRIRDDLQGQFRFIFQPSEEKLPGGAKPMIDEGALGGANAPSAIFGQHVQPDLPVGQIGVRSGMYMASSDEIYITVRGEGGHAAAPHRLQTDAVLAASHIVVALQSIISRSCPPNVPSVLTIGRVIADGATNVIPEQARLEGTFRAMDEAWRFEAHELIKRIVHRTAEAHGASADVDLLVGYPALFNHPDQTRFVREAAAEYVGEGNVVDLEPWYASEDFAWYLRELPGSFYRIGTGNPSKGIRHGLHTPRFTIDEDALRIAPGFMAFLAASYALSPPPSPE